MKWIKLYKNYPEAMKKYVNTLSDFPADFYDTMTAANLADKSDYILNVHYRNLFDFFDEQGIYISIAPKRYMEVYWYGSIEMKQGVIKEPTLKLSTRKEIELWAIEEAFKILQDKILFDNKMDKRK